jgi:CheY-like chemotaxis protein
LQSASARLLQIQDEERRRLARELHDTTGQELSAAIMSVDGLARSLVDPTGGLRRTALACAERLRKIETQIRTLSYVLHPPLLDEMGLGSALRWFLEGFAKRTGIEVKADIPANVPRFSIEKETALFRVIQEGLTNVFRHSGSRRATVRLQVKPSAIEALVEDEGKGFSDEGGTPRKHGVGIQSMKGRLEIVGGNLELHTNSRGTTVVATVPVDLYELMTAPDRLEQRSAENELVAKSRRRILIADDHHVARRGIRTLFDGEPDLEICGEASDGVEALQRTKELKPDLVILDLSMPNMGGLTVANHIRNTGLSTKILVYTSHSYPQLEQTARAAGCDGYVAKSDASHDLIRATRTVLGGGKFYRSEMGRAQTA